MFKRLLFLVSICIIFWSSLIAQSSNCLSTHTFTVVVLGSSTAAGTGPTHSDSAWVNKYRKHLQALNSKNEVINLALGGRTTYHIMPDNFAPSIAGRPTTDTLRNITHALSFNPDAIIVNMPSNDASNGFDPSEQLFNFDSLVAEGNAAGVPVWICTTQPRNGLGATATQWQIDVKDSILARYGNYAIDFWNGIATPTGTIDPVYDQGDGIHLNNAGHSILTQRTIGANIPLQIFQAKNIPDYGIIDAIPIDALVCGDSSQTWNIYISNFGTTDSALVPIELTLTNTTSGLVSNYRDTLRGKLNACDIDTISLQINSWNEGVYELKGILQPPAGDTIRNNDSIFSAISFVGHPTVTTIADTACPNSALLLEAQTGLTDSLIWYDVIGGLAIEKGNKFATPTLINSKTYYVQSVRGPFHNDSSLTTTNNSNVDWNGIMFDVRAKTLLYLDSLAVKVASIGTQIVEIYTKTGSYKGHEASAISWTLHTIDTVFVSNGQTPVVVHLDTSILVNSNDTIGIYVKMQDFTSNVSYLRVTNAVTRTNSELEIETGTGISHNYTGSFFPRDWNGTVFYHFGFKPLGTCQSNFEEVIAFIDHAEPNLGNDTSIALNESITIDAGPFISYLWSSGDTTSTLLIDPENYGLGTFTFYVDVISENGCMGSDTIKLTFTPPTGLVSNSNENKLFLYPNPNSGSFNLELDKVKQNGILTISDSFGRILYKEEINKENKTGLKRMELENLSSGLYHVNLSTSGMIYSSRLIITQE